MTAFGPALLAVLATATPPSAPQVCPCAQTFEGAEKSNNACAFGDFFREGRLRSQMEGPLTVNARRTWKGSALPSFIPQTDGELSLQLMDLTSEGYFAVWRNLYGKKTKADENPRARARLYDCKGNTLWTIELNEFYPRPDHLELQDARYVDGILYFNEACQSYAKEAGNKCSWLVALDPRQRKVLWKTDPLTSNGRFYVTKHYIVAVYAFTAEQRFIRVIKRQDGSLVAKTKLVGHHEYEDLVGEDLHVRTEEGDEYFALDGLRAGTLKTIRPHRGPPTVADAGIAPKAMKAVSCRASGAAPKLIPVVKDRTDAAFSSDGRVQAYIYSKDATVVTDKQPKGLLLTDDDFIIGTAFSPNSDKVALIGAQRGIAVHSTEDGHLIRLIAQPSNSRRQDMLAHGVQFDAANKLYFVGGCQQAEARLFVVDLAKSAAPQPIGAPFQCNGAWATPDARSYLIEDDRKPGSVYRMDTSNGSTKTIVQGTDDAPLSETSVSTNRDWICFTRKWRRTLLFCQNVNDGRLLNLGERGKMTGFSETGARTIIAGGEQNRDTGKERERVFFVDLEADTSTELLNAPYKNSGGFPALFGDGRVLATPNHSALSMCNVMTGAAYTIRESSLYGLFSMPGPKIQLAVAKERSNGVQSDIFRIELPSPKAPNAKK